LVADYAAIEARCVLWEAGADKALDVFRNGGDIYCDMASGIYGREITKATAKPINAMGATERDFGKVAILGLGYGMGFLKFLITLRTYNIILTRAEVVAMMGAKKLALYEAKVRKKLFPNAADFDTIKKYRLAEREAAKARRALSEEREDAAKVLHELALCKYTVDTYRSRYPEVPAMWKAQEAAAIKAVQTGKKVKCGVVTWCVRGRFLKCRLPSGRCLNYADPFIKLAKTSWGAIVPSLRFYATNQKTKKWQRDASYGGKLTENITQAIARDVLGQAKINIAENDTYDLILSVHDEIISEVDEGAGDEEELRGLMRELIPAMAGCPIDAEPMRYTRYRK
jgi:DNA polymerase